MYKLKIFPVNIEINLGKTKVLKEVLAENGILVDYPCGGIGKCKKCKVKIVRGNKEEAEVLACQYEIKENTVVYVKPKKEGHNILQEGQEREVKVNPLVKKLYVKIPKPSIADNRSDWGRIKECISYYKDLKIDLLLLRKIPTILRENNFHCTLIIADNQVIGIEPGDTTDTLLGMAFDIGTTTIVGYLINLSNGKEINRVSALNPQTKYGADVISRITFASAEKNGLDILHEAVIGQINLLVEKALIGTDYTPENIYAVTFAGNTTMSHLLLKITPAFLALSPYVPVLTEAIVVRAKELKIKVNPDAPIFVLPNIAGFVGADTVAATLAAELDKANDLTLLIDIGTNGEMVLGTKNRLLACSTAAGPAFEGAHIACGMRGAEGAIDHVYFADEFQYTVIGNTMPQGICGSGLIDVIAGLLEVGIIDSSGRLLSPEKIKNERGKKLSNRIKNIDGTRVFVLEENTATGSPIYISQKDIRELQLAKGAVAAGIEILLNHYGAKLSDIKEILLAGAFGNYLLPESACKIGLLPWELKNRIKVIGNAAGLGAKYALIAQDEYQRALEIARKIEYIELSAISEFTEIFTNKMGFDFGGVNE
ncbi:ASKHA domain-containing protein [Carboxydothermus ferrireducens]|uniref:Uncharacterized 2Fe-2S/4Fe-4S cluster protein (DUF4445 family) n=1 Tax=Carboxydothermus ferrireducens DSM 11255 TaxID=1119529 RepID=A0ABX2RC20_9THEO|nr:ASKHA domain-containing protein [Carboxydothermus ferrireducens]NYE58475.1 uncharacterized 2Fe-2S/4Fe-4S cluster protein (DUF4445 family) [Carboxydothermus ferrireducens DSM 11255]